MLEATKDPHVFDFLELTENAKERHLEQGLIDDIQKFLLELGQGFAFYGRQEPVIIGGNEFFLDLLFYHHRLRRFVVIDLKIGEFEAEFVSKMNLYLNAVDEQMRCGDDRESVGIITQLPEVEIADDIPADMQDDLAGLPEVKNRLIERVSRRKGEIEADVIDAEAEEEPDTAVGSEDTDA